MTPLVRYSLRTSTYAEVVSRVGVLQRYTLLQECGHMQPRTPPNVFWEIRSQCVLGAFTPVLSRPLVIGSPETHVSAGVNRVSD